MNPFAPQPADQRRQPLPAMPAISAGFNGGVRQLHSSSYRNPAYAETS